MPRFSDVFGIEAKPDPFPYIGLGGERYTLQCTEIARSTGKRCRRLTKHPSMTCWQHRLKQPLLFNVEERWEWSGEGNTVRRRLRLV